MANNIVYQRKVSFRDVDKNSWVITFEVRNNERICRNRNSLEEYTEPYEISVCGSGGRCSGQCYDCIKPRTDGQKRLLEFWQMYHLNGWSAGTDRQNEYLKSDLYQKDYDSFVSLFLGYNEHYRENFDYTSLNIIAKCFNCLTQLPTVRTVINKYLNDNPICYILGLGKNSYVNRPHGIDDLYVKYFFLAIRGLYKDRGYKYGTDWLHSPLPADIQQRIDSICDLIEKEEQQLTEELDSVFDMGADDFVATHEIVEQVMQLRDCDGNEARRFIALGMHLGCTFGDLNDTFEAYGRISQLYSANGIEYYIGTFDELTEIADEVLHDGEYKYLWQEAVRNNNTEQGLEKWLQEILDVDGFASVLNHWDGSYNEEMVDDVAICICRT